MMNCFPFNFAFNFNLRRYSKERFDGTLRAVQHIHNLDDDDDDEVGRCRLTLSNRR